MKSTALAHYIGNIDDRLLQEAQEVIYKKPPQRHTKRFVTVLVAAIIILSLATVALAATGIIDFRAILNSIFSNEEASPFIQDGDDITVLPNDNDVIVEPLAAFFDNARSGMYIEVQITDTTGNRLTDTLEFVDNVSGEIFIAREGSVRFIDENTIVAGLFITPVNIGDTTIRFDTIASGLNWGIEERTEFSISEHIGISNPVVIQGAEFIEITGVTLDDNRLAISRRKSDASIHGYGSASLGLQKPDGEIIWSNFGELFSGGQTEFFDISGTSLDDLTLVWTGVRYDHVITGNWEFTVLGENILEARVFNGEFEGHSTNLILGATSVSFQIYADYYNNAFPYDYMAEDAVTILLRDGTYIHPKFEGDMMDSMMASIWYITTFINPADVDSITFFGVIFGG